MTASPQTPMNLRQVMAIPAFRSLWISQIVSIFGDFLALYAIIATVTYRMHGTPRQVTLISVFFILPLALISPIAGVFVDRWDARKTMIASDLTRGVLILGLLLAQAPYHYYIVLFAASVFSSFFMPAQSVVLPQIVPMTGLLSANAAMQQAMQIVRIFSPAVSVAIVGQFGEQFCYYLDSASFFISAIMLSTIRIPPRPEHANKELKSVMDDLFSGMRFIFGHATVGFVILSIAAGMFALGAFGSLVAVYTRDVLHAPAQMYGTLGSLIGFGALAGSLILTRIVRKIPNQPLLIIIGLLACGLFIAFIAIFNLLVTTIIGCVGIGLSTSMLIIPSMSVMQGQVPHEMRGRVSSSSMSLMTIAQGIALVFTGDLASRFGIVWVYYGSAVLLAAIAGFGFFRLRRSL